MAATKETPTRSPDAPSFDPICSEIAPEYREIILGFLRSVGAGKTIKPEHDVKDSFSNLVGGVLKVVSVERGKLSCLFTVKPAILVAWPKQSHDQNGRMGMSGRMGFQPVG